MNRIAFYIVNFIAQHNSALNKDYSHKYHMERKKLDKYTSECSYEIIMIFSYQIIIISLSCENKKNKKCKI